MYIYLGLLILLEEKCATSVYTTAKGLPLHCEAVHRAIGTVKPFTVTPFTMTPVTI